MTEMSKSSPCQGLAPFLQKRSPSLHVWIRILLRISTTHELRGNRMSWATIVVRLLSRCR